MQSGALQTELLEALLSAFSKPYELDIVASAADLKKSVNTFLAAEGTPYDQAVFSFLKWVEAQNLLIRFLKEARKANPGNPDLARVAAKLNGLENQFKSLRPHDTTFEEAEALVLKNVRFENVGPWLDTLGRMRRAVCRIEPQPPSESIVGYGTGYLVAPDVVMTNFHVAKPFWGDPARAKRVRIRFDYETATSGVGTAPGRECALRTSWPAGAAATDDRPQPWHCLASPEDRLDFALVRLAAPAGEDAVGPSPRGFLALTARTFTPTDPVMILQHPEAEPLKLSFGAVTDLEPDRVRYKVNTLGGSSGSPCLTQNLKVTAIHHFGLADRNRAVTHEAILTFLGQKDNRERLKALGLEHLLA